MAEASILVDQDEFSCPICLDLLKNPVTIHCGHSYCMVCINRHWDNDDQKGVYSCPQCRETFTPRPVLRRNNMLAQMLEKMKKTQLQVASPAHCYAGPEDVECDFCTGRKLKAIKSCLVCVASLCETHLKPHLEIPALMKHQLVKVSTRLQEKICSQHDKLMEIYCRTDQSCICYLCMMHEHKGHDTVAAAAERTEKESELKEVQRKSQHRLQEKKKKLQELKQTVNTIKSSAKTAVKDSEKIFTELIRSLQKMRSEVMKLIRDQEKNKLSQTEELLEKLQWEIHDLNRRNTQLEQLSFIEDHIQFLQSFQSLSVSSTFEESSSVNVQHLSFNEVRKSIFDLKERLEKFCQEEFSKISPHVVCLGVSTTVAVQKSLPSKPKTRKEFLQYFCQLTLDPNTVNHKLRLSTKHRAVTRTGPQWAPGPEYSDHPERFDSWPQVLCKESVSGRCYWEVEWRRLVKGLFAALRCWVSISVSYKGIKRKGEGDECRFGLNNQSWSLQCFPLTFYHNNTKTELSGPSPSKIGVYLDHSAGTLSFYSVSDTMTLLHTVHTTFTEPLYAGFALGSETSVRLCDK